MFDVDPDPVQCTCDKCGYLFRGKSSRLRHQRETGCFIIAPPPKRKYIRKGAQQAELIEELRKNEEEAAYWENLVRMYKKNDQLEEKIQRSKEKYHQLAKQRSLSVKEPTRSKQRLTPTRVGDSMIGAGLDPILKAEMRRLENKIDRVAEIKKPHQINQMLQIMHVGSQDDFLSILESRMGSLIRRWSISKTVRWWACQEIASY